VAAPVHGRCCLYRLQQFGDVVAGAVHFGADFVGLEMNELPRLLRPWQRVAASWAVLTVLVFHRWRLLTPLVFTHIAYDSVLSTANHGLITTTEEFTVLCAATVVLLVVGAVLANFRSIVSREGSAAGVEPIAPR